MLEEGHVQWQNTGHICLGRTLWTSEGFLLVARFYLTGEKHFQTTAYSLCLTGSSSVHFLCAEVLSFSAEVLSTCAGFCLYRDGEDVSEELYPKNLRTESQVWLEHGLPLQDPLAF